MNVLSVRKISDLAKKTDKKKKKKSSGVSPTSAIKKHLIAFGYVVGIVEHFNIFAGVRQDLYHYIDIVATHPTGEVLFIQVTSASNVSARIKKIQAVTDGTPQALALLNGSNTHLLVMGWDKRNKKIVMRDMAEHLNYPEIKIEDQRFRLVGNTI